MYGVPRNGRCKNTVGGFSCKCNQGYALDENGIKCIGELTFSMDLEIQRFKGILKFSLFIWEVVFSNA